MSQWNYARTWETIAGVAPQRVAIVTDDGRRLTFRELDERATRLAHVFARAGIGRGDVVGIALTNRPEYLETFFAALKLGAVPANINYQYRAEELGYVLRDAGAAAIVHSAGLVDAIDAAVRALDVPPRILLAVRDGRVAGNRDFEAALESAPEGPVARDPEPSGDDVMLLYTGGTTGLPKGVIWRTEDYALMGWEMGRPGTTPPDPEKAMRTGKRAATLLPASPLVHGTALGLATTTLSGGGAVVLRADPRFNAGAIWALVERERVAVLGIVGDTFARPLIDELGSRRFTRDVSSLRAIVSSGMTFSPTNKARFLELLPGLTIVDSLGSSEGMMSRSTSRGSPAAVAATFSGGDGLRVLTDDGRDVVPGSGEEGLVMVAGRLPLGYHNDPEATARTFREIDGVRYSVPGDRARVLADGQLELLGRGSSCINTGGEKVYPEEVEEVLRRHPAVVDAGVVGVPDERWGEMVVAVVEPEGHNNGIEAELTEHCREHLAGYKRPKRYLMVERLPRTVAGKPEYVRLREHAAAATARRDS